MSKIPFVDRRPTPAEVERIRLILSTYQDGTGMLVVEDGKTLPGWRDFERAVAVALGGVAQESKAVFDVVLRPAKEEHRPKYGLSCKMRRELNRTKKDGRATIEVSNAAGKFWDALDERGINKENYPSKAAEAGSALLDVVIGWHEVVSIKNGGMFDISKSSYLVLLWNAEPKYQLFQFPLQLFDAAKLTWSVPKSKKNPEKDSRRLCGHDGEGNVVEWYGSSGGQLKLYPSINNALWASDPFMLERLPDGSRSVLHKVEAYFPEQWAKAK